MFTANNSINDIVIDNNTVNAISIISTISISITISMFITTTTTNNKTTTTNNNNSNNNNNNDNHRPRAAGGRSADAAADLRWPQHF